MPSLTIQVEKAAPVRFAASPEIVFDLRIANANPGETIHAVVLRCQLQIEVTGRRYTAEDQDNLRDLFGEPSRWGQTLRNMLWTHANVVVPPFQDSTTAGLPVSCTFDFNVAATKYFAGLTGGEIPLCLMFSGTVFYADADGALQVAPISWQTETRFRLPVSVWQEMMDLYYPNTAWLCLRRDAFERLHNYKVRRGIPTWEEAIERVLSEAGNAAGTAPDNSSLREKLEAMRREAAARS